MASRVRIERVDCADNAYRGRKIVFGGGNNPSQTIAVTGEVTQVRPIVDLSKPATESIYQHTPFRADDINA